MIEQPHRPRLGETGKETSVGGFLTGQSDGLFDQFRADSPGFAMQACQDSQPSASEVEAAEVSSRDGLRRVAVAVGEHHVAGPAESEAEGGRGDAGGPWATG